ncbi:hypothetical protein GQ42DRAFT_129658, partial [Ramicandelaber brevisporus]
MPPRTAPKQLILPIDLTFKLLQRKARVEVWLYERAGTRLEGTLLGFDEYMNMVLDDAVEVAAKSGARRQLGRM